MKSILNYLFKLWYTVALVLFIAGVCVNLLSPWHVDWWVFTVPFGFNVIVTIVLIIILMRDNGKKENIH